MDFHGKMILEGSLTVVSRSCDCCHSGDMVKLLDDESRDIFYCSPCFTTNCKCGGSQVTVFEK